MPNPPAPNPAVPRPSFTPRNWPGWLAAGLLWLLAWVPQGAGNALARPLGALMRGLMASRRRVAARNIERCFPELNTPAQQKLVRDSFAALARTVFETAWAWSPPRWLDRKGRVEGMENLVAANAGGRGILLFTMHSTALEIGAYYIGLAMKRQGMTAAGIYRPLRSPVLEWYQNRGRARYASDMISKRDLRSALRLLRRGGVAWYAPDQDFGPRESEFAPFFGIQAASLLATRKLAEITGCAVVPMYPYYDAATHCYHVRILPALEGFPGPAVVPDLARVNKVTEDLIRTHPEQYWWVHRRFKSRPEGEPPFYG
jgi:KDO2-lipid IV(A) lauroyltransferase